jgi:hypothetical protein
MRRSDRTGPPCWVTRREWRVCWSGTWWRLCFSGQRTRPCLHTPGLGRRARPALASHDRLARMANVSGASPWAGARTGVRPRQRDCCDLRGSGRVQKISTTVTDSDRPQGSGRGRTADPETVRAGTRWPDRRRRCRRAVSADCARTVAQRPGDGLVGQADVACYAATGVQCGPLDRIQAESGGLRRERPMTGNHGGATSRAAP